MVSYKTKTHDGKNYFLIKIPARLEGFLASIRTI